MVDRQVDILGNVCFRRETRLFEDSMTVGGNHDAFQLLRVLYDIDIDRLVDLESSHTNQ
jgi:hypothetical protein